LLEGRLKVERGCAINWRAKVVSVVAANRHAASAKHVAESGLERVERLSTKPSYTVLLHIA
jgi:hypothetical protein